VADERPPPAETAAGLGGTRIPSVAAGTGSGMDKVAVVDYGSQYTQLIARRIREAHVYSEVFSPDVPLARLAEHQAIVLSGGPASVYDRGSPLPPAALFEAGIPVLGICYGMQAMAAVLGGKV
jgi:GMP synthase (glutamine-hydrolysing)